MKKQAYNIEKVAEHLFLHSYQIKQVVSPFFLNN